MDNDRYYLSSIGNSEPVDKILATIKQVESGGNYESHGSSGEGGAYQFMPDTWRKWSSEYSREAMGTPKVLTMTKRNQDAVARYKVESLVNEGYKPEQIFSIWNSGEPDWRGKVGVNAAGVKYDTPSYVQRAKDVYNRLKGSFGPSEAWAGEIVWPGEEKQQPVASPAQQQPQAKEKGKEYEIVWPGDPELKQGSAYWGPSGKPIIGEPIGKKDPIPLPDWWISERSTSPQAKLRFLAARIFPDSNPEETAKNRFFIEDGEIYYRDNDQKVYQVKPEGGKSGQLFAKIMSPQMALGTAGTVVGGILGGPVGAEIGGTIGAIAGGAAEQAISQSNLGEPKTVADYGVAMGKEAAAGLLGSAGGRIATGLVNKGLRTGTREIGSLAAKDAVSLNVQQMDDLYALGQKFGLDYTMPEITNSPTLRAAWANLANTPGAPAEKIASFMEYTRVPQIHDAIQRELGRISSPASTFAAGSSGVGAAKKTLNMLEGKRAKAADKFYRSAYGQTPEVDIESVVTDLKAKLDSGEFVPRGSEAEKRLNAAYKLLTKVEENPDLPDIGKQVVVQKNLQVIDKAKQEIDYLLEGASGETIPQYAKAHLTDLKNQFLQLADQQSPGYALAREKFGKLSRPINSFLYGSKDIQPADRHVKTVLARMVDLGPEAMDRAPRMLFAESPEVIAKTKKWFRSYPDEWNDLVRGYIDERLEASVRDSAANRMGNAGVAFKRAVFGNELQKRKLKAAMDPATYGRFEEFMKALQITDRTIYTNSQTAFQMEARRILKDEAGGWVGRWLRTGEDILKLRWNEPLQRLREPKYAAKVTEMLLDPRSADLIRELKQVPPGAAKAVNVVAVLGSIFGEERFDDWLKNTYYPGGKKQKEEMQKLEGAPEASLRSPVRIGRDRTNGRVVHDYGNGEIVYVA